LFQLFSILGWVITIKLFTRRCYHRRTIHASM